MILTELQDYVREHRRVSLEQLSRRFGIPPPALRGMLDRLALKGRVRRLDRPPSCSGCRICPDAALEFYEWIDADCSAPPSPCSGTSASCGLDPGHPPPVAAAT